MPWAVWKKWHLVVKCAKWSAASSCCCSARWRGQRPERASRVRVRHLLPLGSRWLQRADCTTELAVCGFILILDEREGAPPPRVFLQKSLELLENKRVEILESAKEFGRV